MVKTAEILELIDTIAPFDIAEDWDNSGLQAGNLNWEVKKVMIGLDVTLPLMMSAKKWGADLVLTHHPLIIHPEKTFDFNKMPARAIEIAAKHRISIISAHTNLDKAKDGLNDYFASMIGVKNTRAFSVDKPLSIVKDEIIGIGRIGYLNFPTSLEQLCCQVKEKLNLSYLKVTGNMELPITTIAICTGSGGSMIDEFLESSAEVYITGDIKYHEARRVEEGSKGLIDVGHFGSEWLAIDLLFDKLNLAVHENSIDIQIKRYKEEKDPFTIF